MINERLSRTLALLGALPFLGGAAAALLGIDRVLGVVDVPAAITLYAIVIVAFMAGSEWGLTIGTAARLPLTLPIISNAIAVLLWFGAVLLDRSVLLLLMAVGLSVLFGVDVRLYRRGALPRHYIQTRLIATAIAAPCLLIMALSSR